MYTEHEKKMINKALEIANKAHYGQIDKGGVPYIEHVKTVASKFTKYDEIVVGLLHDLIEDTDYKIYDLQGMGFEQNIGVVTIGVGIAFRLR